MGGLGGIPPAVGDNTQPTTHPPGALCLGYVSVIAGGVKVCLRYDGTPPPGGFDTRSGACLIYGDLNHSVAPETKSNVAKNRPEILSL